MAGGVELARQLLAALGDPRQWAHRIAHRRRLDEAFQVAEQRLSVAVTVWRPPPARRTRPSSSAGPSRSFRPRMIRDRASPVISATAATPLHPAARACVAAL